MRYCRVLTDSKVKNSKPKDKPYVISDGSIPGAGSLILRVMPSGNKQWIFQYRWLGKRKKLTLGAYPTTKLM